MHRIYKQVWCVCIYTDSYYQQGKTSSTNFKYLYRPRDPRFWPASDLCLNSRGARFVQFQIQAYGTGQTLPAALGFYHAWNNTAEDKHGMKQYMSSPVTAQGKTRVSFWFWGLSPPTLWIRGIFLGKAKQIHVISVCQLQWWKGTLADVEISSIIPTLCKVIIYLWLKIQDIEVIIFSKLSQIFDSISPRNIYRLKKTSFLCSWSNSGGDAVVMLCSTLAPQPPHVPGAKLSLTAQQQLVGALAATPLPTAQAAKPV